MSMSRPYVGNIIVDVFENVVICKQLNLCNTTNAIDVGQL